MSGVISVDHDESAVTVAFINMPTDEVNTRKRAIFRAVWKGTRESMLAQRLHTTNDANGNPRRIWVLMAADTGEIVGVIDEGYAGRPEVIRNCVELPSYDVSPGVYNDLRRQFPEPQE